MLRKNRITVRMLGEGGLLWPADFLLRRLGLVVGAAVFAAFCVFLNGRLLGYSLDGVPIEARSGVLRTLKSCGAVRFASFSRLVDKEIATSIVAENGAVGFASVYKSGSFLVVKTLPLYEPGEGVSRADIISPIGGVVERISVFRGTPLVESGERVAAGQPLVGAYFVAGEQTVPTVPAAEIYLRAEYVFSVSIGSSSQSSVEAVIALAREKCPETNIIDQKYELCETEGRNLITVTLTYVKKIGG